MRIDADWLRAPALRSVLGLLEQGGHRAYVVGGAVRNSVMGHPVSDMDIATDARPDRVTELAEANGLKAVATGIEHGTVTVIADGVPFEITTFRRDEETYGRKARVAFTEDLTEDARRRDFTMNALYVDANGEVIDPVGGLADARAGHVRFIEDAGRRIEEDYLRALRFFRFSAVYGRDGLDADAVAAIAERIDGLRHLARERVGSEMRKLLAARNPAPEVASMAQVGVLRMILPGADVQALPCLIHVETEMGLAPDPMRRLASLGGEDAEAALRLSRDEARTLDRYRVGLASVQGPGELAYRLGAEDARSILALRAAMGLSLPDGWAEAVSEGAAAVCPVAARDLMPGCRGRELGERLRAVEDEWIASGFTKSREDLL